MSDHESHPDDDALPLPPAAGDHLFGAPDAAPQNSQAAPYRVLARKYRPQSFDDLIGQESTIRILRRAFALKRVAHAFMLTGVRGVGKTTTARIIARALNCIGPDGNGEATAEPCGVCANCTAILADRHPDVLEMDAASRTGVDDVREIIEQTRFRPIQGRMKVFIIDEVHMLSRNAFNALLKTLEEPPERVTFIFATTELRKVPVTVLSRCQRFDLRRVPSQMLVAHFDSIAHKEGVAFSPEALGLIARASDGSVRDGLSLLDQAIARGAEEGADRIEENVVSAMLGLSDRETVYDLFEALIKGDVARVLSVTDNAYALGVELGGLLGELLELVHFISRLKAVPSLGKRPDLTEVERSRGVAFSQDLSMAVLGRAWQILVNGLKELEIAPDRRGAVEMILLRLCYANSLPTPDDLIRQTRGTRAPRDAEPTTPVRDPSDVTPTALSAGPAEGAAIAGHDRVRPVAHRDLHLVADNTRPAPAAASALHNEAAPAAHSARPPHPIEEDTAMVSAAPSEGPLPEAVMTGTDGALQHPVHVTRPETTPPLPHVAASEIAEPAMDASLEIMPDVSAVPPIRSWREMVAYVKWSSKPLLHGLLRHAAHCVRFEPPEIAIRLQSGVDPRSLARLQAVLNMHYPDRFIIMASHEEGAPTLDEQGAQVTESHRQSMQEDPLVQAIITHFPGAHLGLPRDLSLDDYGLPPENLDEVPPSAFPEEGPDAEGLETELPEDDISQPGYRYH
ncbi:DNA polymerase III subunit gamma/tau [Candidatus Kirkpatrickella diaphorinae]|uniref:DNA polymerase III subunit gamma/tau n=1 Tax=Candidatus Kirkpatrickella diaphorinae TaxID=2984322 RepID=A0ABY6GGV9_9PROT|nr:DNA polymerase III subunit gamma/tau [Candidatus Kirkpatrickella diaphorinae]UYH50640.1 DNA polymerase III subunit gamma/tau [Candidatus Kirkpatrickella diaphorinae]